MSAYSYKTSFSKTEAYYNTFILADYGFSMPLNPSILVVDDFEI